MEQIQKKVIVSLKDIFLRYDGEVILNHINLDIHEKEFVTILGPSGCGKTTTLRIIGGFTEPESGDVIFDGKRINGLPPHKRNVNTVFQKYSLFPHLNVFDNVAFGLKLKKVPKDEIKRKVLKMLAIVDLKGYEKRFDDAMDDDLNTADALGAVFELVKDANITVNEKTSRTSAQKALDSLMAVCSVLGILTKESEEIPAEISAMAKEREEARKNKDWARSDALREQITAAGYILEDTKQGQKVRRDV